jgi:hypothetical protein
MTSDILRLLAEVATIGVAFFWLGVEWQRRSRRSQIFNDAQAIARGKRRKERGHQ